MFSALRLSDERHSFSKFNTSFALRVDLSFLALGPRQRAGLPVAPRIPGREHAKMSNALPECETLSESDLERRLSLCVDFARRRLRGYDVGHGSPSIFFAATLDGVPVHLSVSFQADCFLEPRGVHRASGSCSLLVSDPSSPGSQPWCEAETLFDFLVDPKESATVGAPSARGLDLSAIALARQGLASCGPFLARLEALELCQSTASSDDHSEGKSKRL